MSDLLTLKESCSLLSISTATGRNWIKLHKLIPTKTVKTKPYFSISYINNIKQEIASGENGALKSRRNKNFISGNGIYKSYISPDSVNNHAVSQILDTLAQYQLTPTSQQINLLIAECALQLICQNQQIFCDTQCRLLHNYLSLQLDIGIYKPLIDDLIVNRESALSFIRENESLFAVSYTYEIGEDILGLLYISLKNIGSRKATGSYYTPIQTVQTLIADLLPPHRDTTGKTILDPCCGTGNFLLQLPDCFNISQIYGSDIDPDSIKITRLNLALKFQILQTELLYKNITVSDFLTKKTTQAYDFILGNPPWGCAFSEPEKQYFQSAYQCTSGKSIESYDLFMEHALLLLRGNGILAFVLPKSILNVKSHTPIRHIILEESSITNLTFLGDTFDKVQCPSIILQLVRNQKPFSCIGMTVTEETRSFTIAKERFITADCFHFWMNDREYEIFHKIMHQNNLTTLKDQADFAMGIVTGNNKEYISTQKTGSKEPVLKGCDITRYRIKKPSHFITFTPEYFQQVASEDYYRAPEKLFYRFISQQPVFSYDNKQTLSLNSCNMLIPHVEGLDIKYILAVLNSRITEFIFRKYFDSLKVLRSHMEQIPIPVISSVQQEQIITLVNALLSETDDTRFLTQYEELDTLIARLFELTEEEYHIICQALF